MKRSNHRGQETDPTHAQSGRATGDRETTCSPPLAATQKGSAGTSLASRIVVGQGDEKTARIAPDTPVILSTLDRPGTVHLLDDAGERTICGSFDGDFAADTTHEVLARALDADASLCGHCADGGLARAAILARDSVGLSSEADPDHDELLTDGSQDLERPPLKWDSLTRFQIDLLLAAAQIGPCKGLRLKRELELYYGAEVNHGRLYPNLDELVERGLLEKEPKNPDDRSNRYELTESARDALAAREQTIGQALAGTGRDSLPTMDGRRKEATTTDSDAEQPEASSDD
jgi:DNA-binding PadR family transcriptional regulator